MCFRLLDGDIFLRNLILMLSPPLSMGLPLSTLAPAPSLPIPLLLLTLLMENWVLCKGASDCPRVLTFIEKNDYMSSSGASLHKEGSRTLTHTLLMTSSLQRPLCD